MGALPAAVAGAREHRSQTPGPATGAGALDGILFALRTGCQWKALDATGICSGTTAHARFQEWVRAGVFRELWRRGLLEYDELKGIDWTWLSMDGAMTKAPLGGEKKRSQPHRPREMRGQAQRVG